MFTALLFRPRELAHSLPDHVNSDYVFDLDGDENGEDHPLHHPLFSVDSKSCGECFARIQRSLLSCCRQLDAFYQVSYIYLSFLVTKQRNSHSCSPNLQIYLVARDVPPANGLPFIAFVALADIPAKEEFTFDYDPRAAERIMLARKAKKKGSTIVSEGGRICYCGAEACRGILS
jgi:histone-lysine N-methyltransferase SUV39H